MLGVVFPGLLEALLPGLARLLLAGRGRVVRLDRLGVKPAMQADGRTESEDHGAPARASSGQGTSQSIEAFGVHRGNPS